MSKIWTPHAEKRVIDFLLAQNCSRTTWDVYCQVSREARADENGTITQGNVASYLDDLEKRGFLTKTIKHQKANWKVADGEHLSLRCYGITMSNA